MANRLLTINIRNYLVKQPRRRRHARISRYVRYKIAQYTNIRQENINISGELNSIIQTRYLHSMMPLKVSINIEKDKAKVTPFGEKKAAAATTTTATKTDAKAAPQPKQESKGGAKSAPSKNAGAKDSKK